MFPATACLAVGCLASVWLQSACLAAKCYRQAIPLQCRIYTSMLHRRVKRTNNNAQKSHPIKQGDDILIRPVGWKREDARNIIPFCDSYAAFLKSPNVTHAAWNFRNFTERSLDMSSGQLDSRLSECITLQSATSAGAHLRHDSLSGCRPLLLQYTE